MYVLPDKWINPFNFGTRIPTDLLDCTFYQKEVPLIVKSAPKPELIIWENIDFVNKRLSCSQHCSRYGYTLLIIFFLFSLTIVFSMVLTLLQEEIKVPAEKCTGSMNLI